MNLWNKNNSAQSNSESFNLVQMILGIGIFLSPFFFLPFTADIIEVNKAYLLMLVAVLTFFAFAFHGFKRGSLYIKSFSYYVPFLILLSASVVSLYFSANLRNSLLGNIGSYLNSFIVLSSLTLIAFVAINVRLKIRNLLNYFMGGLLITILVAFSGFYSPLVPYLGRLLSTSILAESYTSFLAMMVFGAGISIYFIFFDKKEDKNNNLLYYVILFLALVYLAIMPDVYSIIALGLIIGYLALTQKDFDFNENVVSITAISVFVVVIAVLHYIPPVKEALGFNPLADYPRLDLVSSWYVAASSIIGKPFWGVGLNNYVTAFSEFRPAYLNTGQFWNVRYAYPFNDIFTWLTTGGLIGLFAYLIFIYLIIRKGLSKRDIESKDPVLNVSTIIAVICLLLLGYSFALYILLFVFAACLFQNNRGSVFALKTSQSLIAVVVLSLFVCGLFGYQAFRVYASQYYLRQSFLSDNLLERYRLQRIALKNNPTEPAIYREAILTNLAIANRLLAEEKLTDDQRVDAQNLLTQAINDSTVLTEVLDSRSATNWEVRAILNRSLIGLDGEDNRFSTIAAQSYLNAISRDPSNPELRISLGNIYYQKEDYVSAANYFIQAIQLKNDYANSYYNLAYALKDAGDYANAVTQLEVVQRLIPQETEQSKQLAKEIEEFKTLAENATENTEGKVEIPEGVKNPNVEAGDVINQTLVGPEESSTYQLNTEGDGLDIKPAEVKEDQNINLNEEDF